MTRRQRDRRARRCRPGDDPVDRGRGSADLRPPADRQALDLQGQPLLVRQRPLRNGKLQAEGEFTLDDGTRLSGIFLRPCSIRE